MMEAIGTKNTIVFGKVVEIADGKGAAAGKVTNVTIKGQIWNGSANEDREINVAFWDNSDKGGANMAERAKIIKEDSYIMARCSVANGKYSGQDFKFKGQYVIDAENDQKTSITLGNVTHKLDSNGKMRYSVPVESYVNGENVTVWQGVNFTQKKAAAAEKIFAKDDKSVQAILIGFAPETNTVGDRDYTNVVVYQFEIVK